MKTKTNWKNDVDEYKKVGEELVQRLRERLEELDKERTEVANQLKLLNGKSKVLNNKPRLKNKDEYNRYGKVSDAMVEIIEEAGEDGISLNNMFEILTNDYRLEVTKNTLSSTIARLKEKNTITTRGTNKRYRYILAD